MATTNKKTIARQRIQTLYRQAHETYPQNPDLSRRYTQLIQKISQRNRVQIPPQIKHNICPKCNTVQIQGTNSHTRLRQHRQPHTVTTCHTCGHVTRRPYRKPQK